MNRPGPLLWLGVLALAALALAVERWIVTDTEAIEALVDEAVAAVKDGDFERLAGTIDANTTDEGMDREALVARIRQAWRRYRPIGLDVVLEELRVEGDVATSPATVKANVMGRPQAIPVEAVFRKTPEGWRIAGARPWPR